MIERAMALSGREMSGLSLESAPKRTLTRSLSPFPILCTRPPPKEISLTDPQAAWVARKSTDPFFAYDANYLIDNKAGIIVDAE